MISHNHIRCFVAVAAVVLIAVLPAAAQQIDFIRTDLNHISMNGDDWSDLRRAMRQARRSGG